MSGIVRDAHPSTGASGDDAEQRFGDAYEAALTRKRLFKVRFPDSTTCMHAWSSLILDDNPRRHLIIHPIHVFT